MTTTIVPAYGRDYRSAKAVREAWAAGHDFRIASTGPYTGSYVNKADAPPGTSWQIRYDRLRKTIIVKA